MTHEQKKLLLDRLNAVWQRLLQVHRGEVPCEFVDQETRSIAYEVLAIFTEFYPGDPRLEEIRQLTLIEL